MKDLNPRQLKALSEFFNTIAAAWFSAGVISPIFSGIENLTRTVILLFISALVTLSSLYMSLYLLREAKT